MSARLAQRLAPLLLVGLALAAALLAGCRDDGGWHAVDVAGAPPPLDFAMTRAADGKAVTAADYRGDVVLLYLGYTYCPDVCPTTLSRLDDILARLGPAARRVRVLFVTVDPARDTRAALAAYAKAFGPQVVGLRGTADQLTALARRYRLIYSVTPASTGHAYEVIHSEAVYVFDGTGAARLLIPSLSDADADDAGIAADLRRLAEGLPPQRPNVVARK